MIDSSRHGMDIMDAAGKKDRAIQIKYASVWRGLANTYKNFQGTLEGMVRANILDVRQKEEKEFTDFLHSKPELDKKYGTVLADIAKEYENLKLYSKKQLVSSRFIRVQM